MSAQGWIGVDLDGTLAEYYGWPADGSIGKPVPAMVEQVKRWLEEGKDVRIFTARICPFGRSPCGQHDLCNGWQHPRGAYLESTEPCPRAHTELSRQLDQIRSWSREHIGQELTVTYVKDFAMVELWDDRCVAVEQNTGRCFSWRWRGTDKDMPLSSFNPEEFDEGAGWEPPK